MNSRRTKALAALLLGPALAARASAGNLPADFDAAQAAVRADLAIEDLWQALELADKLAGRGGLTPARRAWALEEAARLRTRTGDAAGAERNLRDALLASPRDPELLLALARLLGRTRPEAAVTVADEAVEAAAPPRKAPALELAGELRAELGDAAGARAGLARALENGGGIEALAAMARVQADRASAAEYAARAQRAAEREPKWSRGAARRFCARLWLELGDDVRAARAFEGALAVDPDDLDALQGLSGLRNERPGLELKLGDAASSADSAEAPAASDELETLRRTVERSREQGRAGEALAAADLFLEKVSDAPEWRRPEAYAAISESLLKLGPAAKDRAYAAASTAHALNGPGVAVALLLMRSGAGTVAGEDPGSVEYAGNAFRSVFAERLRLGDRDGARNTVARGLRLLPESVQLRLDVARLTLDDGRPAEALKELARLPPGSLPSARLSRAEAYELRARAEHALKDDEAAEKSLQDAVAEAPVEREELKRAAALEAEIGLSTAAFAHLDRLLAVSESPYERAEAFARRSEVQRAFKDDAGAEASLERALTYVPDDLGLLGRLIDLEAAREDPKALASAERLVRAAAAAGPAAAASAADRKAAVERTLAAAESRKARGAAARGDSSGAEAGFVRALALVPNDREALGALLELALAGPRREEARTYADRLVAASRDLGAAALSDADERQAQALRELGDEAGAEAALGRERKLEPELRAELKRSLEKKPGDWPALKRLADLDLRGGAAREALELVERHPAAAGMEAPWLVWRGAARAASGDETKARQDFEAAAKRDAAAACLGGELPSQRESLALAYFDACLERLPGEPRLYVDRGLARFQAGRAEAALEDFRRAVSLKPDSPEAQLSLVSALESQGRAGEALAAADRALALVGESAGPLRAGLIEAKRRLEKTAPSH